MGNVVTVMKGRMDSTVVESVNIFLKENKLPNRILSRNNADYSVQPIKGGYKFDGKVVDYGKGKIEAGKGEKQLLVENGSRDYTVIVASQRSYAPLTLQEMAALDRLYDKEFVRMQKD